MPSASETHAMAVTKGVLSSVLMANSRLRTTPSDETRGATVGSVRRQPREQGPMVRIPGDGGDLPTVKALSACKESPRTCVHVVGGRCVLRKSLAECLGFELQAEQPASDSVADIVQHGLRGRKPRSINDLHDRPEKV